MASVFPVQGYVSDNRRALVRIDGYLILSTVILMVIGLMSLYSQSQGIGSSWFRKQLINVGIGLVPFTVFAWVHPKVWVRAANALYVLSLSMLVLVLVHGKHTKGAGRWIPIGSLQFQPSELVKILTILTLAAFYTVRQDRVDKPSTMLWGLAHVMAPTVLILRQPHLGAAVVMMVMWFAVSLVAGVPIRYLAALCGAGIALLGIGLASPQLRGFLFHGYQAGRVEGLFTKSKDHQGEDYQTFQAEIAFAEGGLSGTGFLHGEQKAMGFIPEQQNDFIFTVVGEEGGLIGCTLVLLSYGFFFYRIWLTMVQSTNLNTKMIVGGIFAILGFHTFANIAMVLQMLPVVGLWLPFLSYGGTAMWLCMACVGLMVGVQRRERPILF